jgi:hypothetical protein
MKMNQCGYHNMNMQGGGFNMNQGGNFGGSVNISHSVCGTLSFNAMSDDDVKKLIKRMKDRSFDDDMLDEVSMAFSTNVNCTAEQAKRIVKTIDFDQTRAKACIKIYLHLSDKQNVGVMLSAMDFDDCKRYVKNALGL